MVNPTNPTYLKKSTAKSETSETFMAYQNCPQKGKSIKVVKKIEDNKT